MSLTLKDKELVSIGASLAAGCKTCINYHFAKVRKAGASDEEIQAAMEDAVRVRDDARKIMERHGFKLLGLFRGAADETEIDEGPNKATRVGELVSIAAAFSVNCTSSVERHIAAARTLGVTEEEIEAAVDVARFIKGKAESLCCKLI
jgi:AhpD family alkylhydroperoxidase